MSRYNTYSDIIAAPAPQLHHKPMDIGHRAKQFAPFAALKGFEECITAQEKIYTERRQLSEDRIAEMNFRLRMLQYGMRITVTYFVMDLPSLGKGHYEVAEGKVRGYDAEEGLRLDNRTIRPENLYDLAGDGMDDLA